MNFSLDQGHFALLLSCSSLHSITSKENSIVSAFAINQVTTDDTKDSLVSRVHIPTNYLYKLPLNQLHSISD